MSRQGLPSEDLAYISLPLICKALTANGINHKISFNVISSKTVKVNAYDMVEPLKALSLGALKVISTEYPHLQCQFIDIDSQTLDAPDQTGSFQHVLIYADPIIVSAIRNHTQYEQEVVSVKTEARLRGNIHPSGSYLITGGLGGMGLTIAADIAEKEQAKLSLITRRSFPAREAWEDWIEAYPDSNETSLQIKQILQMERYGASVRVYSGDVSDLEAMRSVIQQVYQEYGHLNGIIWAAGIPDYAGIIERRDRIGLIDGLKPKVQGILNFSKLINFADLDFVALFSSSGNLYFKEKFGQVTYNAGNEFLDAFAQDGINAKAENVFTIDWCDWKQVGMSVASIKRLHRNDLSTDEADKMIHDGVTPAVGAEVFRRCLQWNESNYIISTLNLEVELNYPDYQRTGLSDQSAADHLSFERPDLSSLYRAPESQMEQGLIKVCEELFGISGIGVDDDFYHLGGDSMKAIQFLNLTKERLKIDIEFEELFAYPTMSVLARFLTSRIQA